MISVVIPAYNAEATLDACLASAFADGAEEVVVADDGSTDGTAAVAARHPCRLLRLPHAGAAATRNAGAAAARGGVLFFTDADCTLLPGTLRRVAAGMARLGPRALLGGTYAVEPADPGFLARFQAVFVNEAETRSPDAPDYVATHALAVRAGEFRAAGGFDENFPLPILEDVEFSHRLRRAGFRLAVDPALEVRHRFGFTLARSLANAARKTRHWIRYSIGNRDLFAESGTASRGIKADGAAFVVSLAAVAAAAALRRPLLLAAIPLAQAANLAANAPLLRAFRRSHGAGFAAAAALYYAALYPAAIWAGAAAGVADWLRVRGGGGR